MAKLVVMYSKPADAAAFDDYYFNKHVPLAKTIPGLRSYEVNAGPVATPQGPSPYHLIATLTFDLWRRSVRLLLRRRARPPSPTSPISRRPARKR